MKFPKIDDVAEKSAKQYIQKWKDKVPFRNGHPRKHPLEYAETYNRMGLLLWTVGALCLLPIPLNPLLITKALFLILAILCFLVCAVCFRFRDKFIAITRKEVESIT